MRIKRKFLATASLTAALALGCSSASDTAEENAAAVDAATDQKNTNTGSKGVLSPNSLALSTVGKLEANLIKIGVSDTKAGVVSKAAKDKIEAKKTALSLVDDSAASELETKYEKFSVHLLEGALDSLDAPEFVDDEADLMNKILAEIVRTVVAEMKGNVSADGNEQLFGFLEGLSSTAISTLNEAGFEQTELGDAGKALITAAISSLDDAGILTAKNASKLISAVVRGCISSLEEMGIDPTAIVWGDGELDIDAEFLPEGIEAFDPSTDPYATGAPGDMADPGMDDPGMAGPGEFGLTTALPTEPFADLSLDSEPEDVFASFLYDFTYGAISALDEAGFSTKQTIAITKHVMESMVASLDEAGFDTFALAFMLDEAVWGAMDGLEDTAISDEDEIVLAVGAVVEGVIAGLNEAGVAKEKMEMVVDIVIQTALGKVSTIEALTDAKYADVVKTVIAKATAALQDAGFTKEDSDQMKEIISSIMGTAIASLDDMGFDSAGAKNLMPDIYKNALDPLDGLGFDATELSEFRNGIDFSDEYDSSELGDLDLSFSDAELEQWGSAAESEAFDDDDDYDYDIEFDEAEGDFGGDYLE